MEEDFPWIPFFDWVPKVGDIAQMNTTILPDIGYVYMDPVRILSIEGNSVTCSLESPRDHAYYKNGIEFTCKFSDLWPYVYPIHRAEQVPQQETIF